MAETIDFKLNDQPVHLKVDGERTLLWVLRTDLKLTGTKFGCGEGHCGACTVLVDNVASRSCLLKMKSLQGKTITTIEGVEKDGKLHPLQQAFMAHDAFQCGFCTPGMILTGAAFLKAHPNPTREEIVRGLDENLCRCGAQVRIVDAIQSVAAAGKGGSVEREA